MTHRTCERQRKVATGGRRLVCDTSRGTGRIPKVVRQLHEFPISGTLLQGSLNVPMFHITQPLGIWSIMATIRWCPIFPSHGTFTNPCSILFVVYNQIQISCKKNDVWIYFHIFVYEQNRAFKMFARTRDTLLISFAAPPTFPQLRSKSTALCGV